MKTFFYVLLFVFFFLIGCSSYDCPETYSLVNGSCCVDSDMDRICDSYELVDSQNLTEKPITTLSEDLTEDVAEEDSGLDSSEETSVVVYDPKLDFAKTFSSSWSHNGYKALHSLFEKNIRMKFSAAEFSFLSRRAANKYGISFVRLKDVEGSSAVYTVTFSNQSEIDVSAEIIIDPDDPANYNHKAFFLFADLDPYDVCGLDAECFYDYALISGNNHFCSKTGSLKDECAAKLSGSKSVDSKIRACNSLSDYYTKAACLSDVAQKENTIEPCWSAGYDKQVYECMGFVAAIENNVSKCPIFASSRGFPGSRIQLAHCIIGYVQKTGNTTVCANIDRRKDVILGAMAESCYKLQLT